jgi:hypothetical protein
VHELIDRRALPTLLIGRNLRPGLGVSSVSLLSIFNCRLSTSLSANSFPFSLFRTLCPKPPGVGYGGKVPIRWKTEVRYPSTQLAQGGLQK